MKIQIGVIALVAIVLVAGMGFLFVSSESEGASMTGEITFHIQEVGTNDELIAEVDYGDLTLAEQMVLTFSGSVRTTSFEPLDYSGGETIPQLKKTADYNIWAVARVHVTANEDIVSVADSAIIFSALINNPSYGVALVDDDYVSGSTDRVDFNDCLELNQDVVKDMALDAGKKFTHKFMDGASRADTLQGHNIDGMELSCQAYIKAYDTSDTLIEALTLGVFTLTVSDWIEPELSISITAMGKGSDTLSIMPGLAMMFPLGLLGLASFSKEE
jgi:hypothetical protein